MKNGKTKRRLRKTINLFLWVLLVQFILINVSAALYADKFTHLHTPNANIWTTHVSNNIFAKTWRLFKGPRFYKQTLTDTPYFSYSTIKLKTKNEISIESWYSKTDSSSKGTVILFHGLMGHKGLVMHEAGAFREFGYNVMMVDVRDHGHSGGNITTLGYCESEEVKLAYEYVQQTGETNIFLWGASLGGVEIIKAVSDYNLDPSGIIAEMPFLSLQSHLEGRARSIGFPSQPFGFLTAFWIGAEHGFNGLGFKTTRYAKNINCPVLLQYGEKDELVLRYETDAIYEALASRNKKLVVYDNAGHELFLQKDPVTWRREVEAFLKRFSKITF